MAMRSKKLLISAIFLITGNIGNASEESKFAETLVTKIYRIGPIDKIIIKNPAASAFSEEARCGNLLIDEKRIRFFLAHAVPDSEHNFKYDMQIGSCQATGLVHFKNGRQANLFLDNETGWGGFTDQKTTYFMRCDACESILEPDFPFDPSQKIDWR